MVEFVRRPRYTFEDFVALIHFLRSPDGCPWDRVQDHLSIRRNFIEEVYECCEALDTDDEVLMREELGDVLMQVLFHADIERDRGRFGLDDICDHACKKLIFRHPNLFGENTGMTWDEKAWETMKALEKGQTTHAQTLDAVARSLPATWRAEKLMKKAAKAGFVWPDAEGALRKLEEEIAELREALQTGEGVQEEMGDVLFAAVCAAFMTPADPEAVLHGTCEKFIKRFAAMEQSAAAQGRSLDAYTPAEQLSLWEDAKADTHWE